jgi:agmatinase
MTINWMNLPPEYAQKETSKFIVLPISYEKDLTFGTGAKNGPKEIIKASKQLEYYDTQFENEPFENGIFLNKTLELSENTPPQMVETVSKQVKELTKENNKFLISLGGDHSVTIGIVKGLGVSNASPTSTTNQDFDIIQFDAHADLRDSWTSQLNHACVAKQLVKNHSILQIGIRSQDVDEANFVKQTKEDNHENQVCQIQAHEENKITLLKNHLKQLKHKIYLTIDIDVFDPSLFPSTGTPEPGGLFWQEIIKLIQIIFEEKQIIAADIVEFAPKENTPFQGQSYSLAKLTYKLMSMKNKFNK